MAHLDDVVSLQWSFRERAFFEVYTSDAFMRVRRSGRMCYHYLYTGLVDPPHHYRRVFDPWIVSHAGYYMDIIFSHPDKRFMRHRVLPITYFVQYSKDRPLIFKERNAKRIKACDLKEGMKVWGVHEGNKIQVKVLSIERKYNRKPFLVYLHGGYGNQQIGKGVFAPYVANGIFISPMKIFTISSNQQDQRTEKDNAERISSNLPERVQ